MGLARAAGENWRWRASGLSLLLGLALLGGEAFGPRQGQTAPLASANASPAAVAPTAPAAAGDSSLDARLKSQPVATVAAGLLVLLLALLGCYLLVLWRRPLWLLRLPDELEIGWDHPLRLGGKPLFRFLKYRDPVLDAWVQQHRSTVEQRFKESKTVEDRSLHLSLPVMVDQKQLELDLTAERLVALNAVGRLVLISGEGGVGKTSLALQIARWALDGKLTKQPVLPVLVDVDRDLKEEECLLSQVRSKLESSSTAYGQARDTLPPSEPLVLALLRRKRLLVILDHFSELGDASRKRLLPTAGAFLSAWVIVTSRWPESFGERMMLHLCPQRLAPNRLWPFFELYLRQLHNAEAKDWDDDLLARAMARLREITAGLMAGLAEEQRGITVLLAKLYIDVVRAERKGEGVGMLPNSVPALMLTYVRQINVAIAPEQRQDTELVVRALQLLAQASEQDLFRPRAVRRPRLRPDQLPRQNNEPGRGCCGARRWRPSGWRRPGCPRQRRPVEPS